jgi:hypothetical protein
MKLKLISCLLFASGFTQLFAQHSKWILQPEHHPAKTVNLRFNGIGLLDPIEPNLSVGAEYFLKENISVATDAGYVLYYNDVNKTVKNTSGYIVKPGIQFYFGQRQNAFFRFELHYKHVNYQVEDWLNKNVVGGVSSYQEFQRFTYRRDVFGFNAIIGLRSDISQNGRFYLEYYVGVGLRKQWDGLKKEPNSSYTSWNFPTVGRENDVLYYPALPLGIRLVYRLK